MLESQETIVGLWTKQEPIVPSAAKEDNLLTSLALHHRVRPSSDLYLLPKVVAGKADLSPGLLAAAI